MFLEVNFEANSKEQRFYCDKEMELFVTFLSPKEVKEYNFNTFCKFRISLFSGLTKKQIYKAKKHSGRVFTQFAFESFKILTNQQQNQKRKKYHGK